MVGLFLSLVVFVAFPLVLVAIALKSKAIAIIGFGLGGLSVIWMLMNAFSEFLLEHQAMSLDAAVDESFHALWRQVGPERGKVRFWVYPSSGADYKVWMNGNRFELFFSQGFLSLATDAGLRAVFKSMIDVSVSDIKLQNLRHALSLRLERLKGPKEAFRYWFLSFWLYPLERWLKIARIEACFQKLM